MPRLFTALELPEAVRLHLSLIRAPINGARWVEAENMHITLRFAGDIDERTADDFANRLRDIKAEPLAITIAGVGAFAGRECSGPASTGERPSSTCIVPTSGPRARLAWSVIPTPSSRT
jgi:2'-5' RNA ligase